MQLSAYLDANDLTAKAFAEKLGVDPSMVTRWRRRQTIPDRDNMRAIAIASDGAVTANDFHDEAPSAAESPVEPEPAR